MPHAQGVSQLNFVHGPRITYRMILDFFRLNEGREVLVFLRKSVDSPRKVISCLLSEMPPLREIHKILIADGAESPGAHGYSSLLRSTL